MPVSALHQPVLDWYAAHARDLPWRGAGTTPRAVLVSGVMLQQTPVGRVLPAYKAWLARWPTPLALAADPPGAAVRQWGRLGYPRRALRLHAAARACAERHGGRRADDDRGSARAAWRGPQRARALQSLVADGLVEEPVDGRYRLPTGRPGATGQGEEAGPVPSSGSMRQVLPLDHRLGSQRPRR